jgi:hypothetical protein
VFLNSLPSYLRRALSTSSNEYIDARSTLIGRQLLLLTKHRYPRLVYRLALTFFLSQKSPSTGLIRTPSFLSSNSGRSSPA